MTIRTRLVLLFFAAFAFAAASGMGAIWAMRGMQLAQDEAQRLHGDQIHALELQIAFLHAWSEVAAILSGDDTPEAHERLAVHRARIDQLLMGLQASTQSSAEEGVVRAVADGVRGFTLCAERALYYRKRGEAERGYNLLRRHMLEMYAPITAQVRELIDTDAELIRASETNALERTRLASAVIAGHSLVLLLLGVLGAYSVWRWLVKPVETLGAATRTIARGEPLAPIPIATKDELGSLAREVEAMAANLNKYQEQIIEKERLAAVGEMTAAVAHNLRNPLASIRALAQGCQRGALPANEVGEAMGIVMQTVDRADRWLKDLLQALRPVRIDSSPQDINRILREVVDAASEFAAKRGVGLRLALTPELPEIALDPTRMNQALFAIVVNAIEASPAGKEVVVSSAPATEDEAKAEIVIADDGPGIGAETMKKIFTPFAGSKKGGTGLGLSLTQRIVHGHRGDIRVDSSPGAGCRMKVLLPFAAR
ncbi:MAG: ATP-binding protein [Planctomycetes bacterium]|nr:ATP-binding protein [Planctomycetota bacterium]